jgi:hypothetical protein
VPRWSSAAAGRQARGGGCACGRAGSSTCMRRWRAMRCCTASSPSTRCSGQGGQACRAVPPVNLTGFSLCDGGVGGGTERSVLNRDPEPVHLSRVLALNGMYRVLALNGATAGRGVEMEAGVRAAVGEVGRGVRAVADQGQGVDADSTEEVLGTSMADSDGKADGSTPGRGRPLATVTRAGA